MFYLCSVAVHSQLHWFALVVVGCSLDALQPITVHYEIEVYSGICASICPLVVMYVELLVSKLRLYVCMYEGGVMSSYYQTMFSALRVVIPTRLTIVRSMSCIGVYNGYKTTKAPFLKVGFETQKL